MSADLDKAVRAMRLYLGSVDFASVKDQQKLYNRASRAVDGVSKKHGLSKANAWEQIASEARRQGVIRPMPGQHF